MSSMACCRGRIPRGLKICCAITTILVIIIIVVAVILFFTILKPRKPKLTTKSVILDNIELEVLPVFHLNITLGIVVTVDNHNYGSFKYGNSTVYVTYRGTQAAQSPIQESTIPARAKHDVNTTVTVIVDNLEPNPYFRADFNSGILNFTSSTALHGKATVLKFLKLKVSTYTTCDISVYVHTLNASSACQSKIKY